MVLFVARNNVGKGFDIGDGLQERAVCFNKVGDDEFNVFLVGELGSVSMIFVSRKWEVQNDLPCG